MIAVEQMARDLDMKPEELMKESIETFLKRKLRIIETELFLLTKKYGVSDVFDFDRMVKEGRLHEEDAFEDYFKFDNLEVDRDLIIEYLKKI